DAAPLGIESPLADVLTSLEGGIAPVGEDAVGGNAERVLIDRAQVEHQPHPCRLGATSCGVLEDPELEIFVPSEIESGGTQWGNHRPPARPAQPFRLAPARGVVLLDDATSGIRVEGEIERRFLLLRLA